MLRELASQLVDVVFDWGYFGIFILMSIESSFIPFPSELVLIPAGYLAHNGDMQIYLIMLSSLFGSLFGAFINYFLALKLGRVFIQRYGKYFFIKDETLLKLDNFFENYGHISTLVGRLIPGIRQLISIPAGIAKMDLLKFSIYTAIGSLIWSSILIALGYIIGENQHLIDIYLKQITLAVVGFIVVFLMIYIYKEKRKVL